MLSRHLVPVLESLLETGGPYADLSVERIITAGGVSRSTFYNYFDDKNDLLVAVARDVIGDLTDAGGSWWSLPDAVTRADIHEALRPALDIYREHRAILGSVVEAATYDHRVRAQQQALVDNVVTSMTDHLRRRQEAGLLDPALDAERAARWTVWMLERGLYQLVAPSGDEEAEGLLDTLTDLVFRAFYR